MKRRKAREYVLQFLYKLDFMDFFKKSPSPVAGLSGALQNFWEETGEDDTKVRAFTEELIVGTIENFEKIDSIIEKIAEKWTLSRMAAIDRNILRAATYELLFRKDIPNAVTINEALEIAKKYSTAESASFINGILDKIARENEAQGSDTPATIKP